jgi:hypothetical protein
VAPEVSSVLPPIRTGAFFLHCVRASRPAIDSQLGERLAGLFANTRQFIVERCDQQELLAYICILRMIGHRANGVRLFPVI